MLRTLETAFIESVTLDTQQFPIAAWQTAQNPENKENLEAFGQRMQRERVKKRIGKGLYGYFQLQKPKKLKAYGQRMRQERGPLRTLRRPSISAITSINRSRNPSPLRLTLFSFTVKVIFYYQIRVILPYYHKVLFLGKDR